MADLYRTTSMFLAPLVEHARKPLFRNAYALMLSAGVTSALGLVYWVVAARYYPSEAVGRNSALISAMTLLSGLAQLNLRSFLTRFIGRAGRGTRRLVLGTYAACSATTLLVCAIFVWNIGWWSPGLSFIAASPMLEVGFVVATLAWGIFVLQDSTLTGLRQAFWVPIENGAFAVGKLVLLVLIAASVADYGIFVSWTVPLVLSLIPINVLIFGRLVPRHEVATAERSLDMTIPQIVRFVGTDYIGGLFSLVASAWLPIIVHDQVGGTMTAYFYQPWLIAASLQIVVVNLAASMTVEAAADEGKVWAYGRAVFRQAALILLPIVGVVLLGAPWILRVFGPDYAREGSALLRLLALAVLPNVVNVLFISLARVQRRMLPLIAIQAALCVGALLLSMVALPRYGITGIGYAWLASQTAVACVLLLRHGRIFRRSNHHNHSVTR